MNTTPLSFFLSASLMLATAACGSEEDSRDESPVLCEEVVDHVQQCCSLTPEQVLSSKATCRSQVFDAPAVELMECTLGNSCHALLNENACGGLTCAN